MATGTLTDWRPLVTCLRKNHSNHNRFPPKQPPQKTVDGPPKTAVVCTGFAVRANLGRFLH
jgi:hypothetical protein